MNQYIDPLNIVAWAIAGGIIGFFIVLITELILRKKILVKRRHWTLKYLSYLYMVFLPLFAGYCFTQWFAVHACERQLVKNVPFYMGSANSAFNKYLKDEVEKVVEKRHLQLTGNEILDKGADLAINTASKLTASIDESWESKLTAYAAKSGFVKDQIVDGLVEKLGEQILMDKELTQEVLDIKVQNLLEDGVLNTVVEKHIKKLSGGLKSNILLIFLIGIAIPTIEIIIANYLEKKRLSEESIDSQNN